MCFFDFCHSHFRQDSIINTELHYYLNHVVILFQSDVYIVTPPEKGKLKNTLLIAKEQHWRRLGYVWMDEIVNLFRVLSFTPRSKSAALAQKRSFKMINDEGTVCDYHLPKLGALVEKTLITNNTVLTCNYKGSQITHASGYWLNASHQGDIEYGLRRFGQSIRKLGNPLKYLSEKKNSVENSADLDFTLLAAMINLHYSFNQMNGFQRVLKSDSDHYLARHTHVLNLAANLL
ncbi:hypothetical protein [Type-D symbiont of Plautia stali]|uniref:hypothetical protein n=1 Tax=Type-D symbiont of Plautia stali TaxID=1560356 RepID=UPI00073E1932|nr:hypothetical protein [Type-D symbiont of Plautia stali]